MGKKNEAFGDTETEKHKFHCDNILITYWYLKLFLLAGRIINNSFVT